VEVVTPGSSGRDWHIRVGQDADGPALIAVIGACWSLYPGVRMDVDREMPELHALATYYGNSLWVADQDGRVVGLAATRCLGDNLWEICRVYVEPALHGSGLARDLLAAAEGHAVEHGAKRLVLWSDTRFDRAHRFYQKRSYVRHGPIRVLHDLSNSLEFGYAKPVNGIEALDVAAAASAADRLAEVLIACVDDGASVSFLPPLQLKTAENFWRQVATDVGGGKTVLLAGWRGGVLVGTGMVDLATPENQPHRAEIKKLLVHPAARRMGLARSLLRELEQRAADAGRSLLTLDTRTGDAAELLYRAEGWHWGGHVPAYTRTLDGVEHATSIFWKRVG